MRACGLEPLHHFGVVRGDIVRIRGHAPGRGEPCYVEALLNGHRQAVQRTERSPLGERPIRLDGRGDGSIEIANRNRVRLLIVALDSFDEGTGELERADLLRAVQVAKGFTGETPRAVATLAIARAVLERREQVASGN